MGDALKSEGQEMLVPMSAPDITDREREAVAAVLNSERLSIGPYVEAFERSIAEYVGAEHAIAVNSGTTGLHLCVRAAGVADGDWVITTPFSFVASANVMLYERAVPIFVDVDPQTGNLDPELVRSAAADLAAGGERAKRWLPRRGGASGPLKALLSVDVFGQPADYESLRSVADEHGLALIEDSCEALGAAYRGVAAGKLGDMAVFAFYPNKQITTGEGGVIVCDDGEAAALMRSLRNQGRAPGDRWLEHTLLGYNYRMDEMSAALGWAQMARIEELLAKRAQVARWYADRLVAIEGVEAPDAAETTTAMSWFVYVVRFAAELDRDLVAQRLHAAGIPSRPYFAPIHLQPYFRERFGYQPGDFPVVEDLGRRSLALPFSSVMTEGQVALVCEKLAGVLAAL